jgi:hypothetical protein
MIVRSKYGNDTDRPLSELYGLSNDEKPIDEFEGRPIYTGSIFIEIDTGDSYFYDSDNKTWIAT